MTKSSKCGIIDNRRIKMTLSEHSRKHFKGFYGFDAPKDFEFDYHFAWCSVDGIIQLLRMDMLPIGKSSIGLEIGLLDGIYEDYYDADARTYLIRRIT